MTLPQKAPRCHSGGAFDPGYSQAQASPYAAIKAEAGILASLGLPLITVIPQELDAERWPAKGPEKNGNPRPAFTGKNPSYWTAADQPRLLSHTRPQPLEVLRSVIDRAEALGLPIGIAVIPSTSLVVADLDRKDFSSAEALELAYQEILAAWPELANTRTERTPGGGLHIYMKVADRMESWRKPVGSGHHCNFTTDRSGAHHGEILHGLRVCVAAPTKNGRGPYVLLNPEHASSLVEVPNLATIGIRPCAVVKAERAAADRAAKAAANTVKPGPGAAKPQSNGTQEPPQIESLLGRLSKEVLSGGRPFGEDRSSNLTGFAKEAYGWENWLADDGLPFSGTADAVIAAAVVALEIEDKAGRVLESIDRASCRLTIADDKAQSRYGFHANSSRGHQREDSAENTKAKAGSKQQQQPPAAGEPPRQQKTVLSLDDVRERLRAAVDDGATRADLVALEIELAQLTNHSPISIHQLLVAIEQEATSRASVETEAATLAAEVDRQEIGKALTLDYLLPPAIAHALRVRCLALPADDVAATITYLVTISGLVKLGTQVIASKAADYRLPINLYAALVAPSGAKKSPLSRLLVNAPTQGLRRELAQHHDRALHKWQEDIRGVKPADRPDPPKAAYLQISDTTAEALAGQLQEQEKRGLGLLLHRDELAGLFGSLNAYKSGRGADEELLLEAFDGLGFHSLRVAAPGGGRFYESCHLSAWGTIQPAVLRALVASGDASGLWARFLFVPLPEKVVPLPEIETETEQRAAADAAQALADAARKIYSLPKADYCLDIEARSAFIRYETRCQGDALRATLSAQSALYGKAAGKVLRIAGLLHLLNTVNGDGASEISAATIERATALVDHLNGWALSFHADLAGGGASDLMRKVHRIAQESTGPIRWKDIQNQLSATQRKAIDSAAVAIAMNALSAMGVGEVEPSPRGGLLYRATGALP